MNAATTDRSCRRQLVVIACALGGCGDVEEPLALEDDPSDAVIGALRYPDHGLRERIADGMLKLSVGRAPLVLNAPGGQLVILDLLPGWFGAKAFSRAAGRGWKRHVLPARAELLGSPQRRSRQQRCELCGADQLRVPVQQRFGQRRSDGREGQHRARHPDLHRRPGDDTLTGGLNNDRFIGGPGADVMNGGTGNDDVVDYSAVTIPTTVSVRFTSTIDQSGAGDHRPDEGRPDLPDRARYRRQRYRHFTAFNDAAVDVHFEGRGGDDNLTGGAGDDLLNGGDGSM